MNDLITPALNKDDNNGHSSNFVWRIIITIAKNNNLLIVLILIYIYISAYDKYLEHRYQLY